MKDLVVKFVKKYPFTFVAVVLLAIFAVKLTELGAVYTLTEDTNRLAEIAMLLASIAMISFTFNKAFDCYNEKQPKVIKENTIVSNLVACILAAIVHFIIRLISRAVVGEDSFITYNLSMIFASIAYFFIITHKKMQVHEYSLKILMNSLALFLIECVVVAGISILYYIYYALFNQTNWEMLMYILVFQFIIISYTGYFIIAEKMDEKITLFAKVLIKYIIFTMVLIGYVFFYIYFINIIIKRSIPSNQVFIVCTILFAGGLPVALMCKNFDNDTIYDKVINNLPFAFIPALILQMISLGMRINQYGLTTTRYGGVAIIISEIVYIVIYIFKYDKMRYILVIEAIMIFIMSFVPMINMYQFPDIYNKIFKIENSFNDRTFLTSEDAEKGSIFQYYNIHEYDIAGYSKMKESQVHLEYDKNENTWKYYHKTSEKTNDFTNIKVEDYDSNAYETFNIKPLLDQIKENIKKNNYSYEEEKVLKDVNTILEGDNKKLILNEINVKYDKSIDEFEKIILYGYLLTK